MDRMLMGSALPGNSTSSSSSSPLPSKRSLFLNGGRSKLYSANPVVLTRKNQPSGVRVATAGPVLAMVGERLMSVGKEKPRKLKVRASVTVRRNKRVGVMEKIADGIDAVGDKMGRNVVLQLISTDVDHCTKSPKISGEAVLKNWLEKMNSKGQRVVCTAEFTVDSDFGTPGAVTVSNRHQREFFVEAIVVEGFPPGPVHFNCYSWVQPINDNPHKRVFFIDKPYLPSETPEGLRELREQELKNLRGDGTGERKLSDRIYDYATYNDLGNPDKGSAWVRPILGGRETPYPRRCRTGRPSTVSDRQAETRVEDPLPVYVPRDERFEEGKREMLDAGQLKAKLHVFVPALVATSEECHDFEGFHEVDSLYKVDVRHRDGLHCHLLRKIPFLRKFREVEALFKYDTPGIITKDKFAWLRDDEFARQAIAGINPVIIERLQVFPPVSKLDPEAYGRPESTIKEEHIAGHLDGKSVEEALKEKRLYVLDYHDIYLPFVDRINSQHGRKCYATRSIFFLTSLGTLTPVAIELSLPPGTPSSRLKQVLTPPVDATTSWVWRLGKAHVCSNDAGVHQLVNHWLKTHASMEPFIIAANRQMSAMHPVFKLLKPHMRYTLEINALARQILISAGGVIESFFTPGSVAMEISAAAYKNGYRFDQENLPDDLIRRGMAERDPTQPHGLRLLIEDYPYAADGLLIWSAISNWVKTYITTFYPTPFSVQSDVELQSWYSEAINVGHKDTRDSPHWPRLTTPDSLINVLTTIIWLCSAQHAALNFGQYPLGGYIPNRPPMMRRLIPDETDPEYGNFLADPHKFFLSSLPSLMQATKFMTVIDTLSTHSVDEEYMGERVRQGYAWSPEVAEAFDQFAAEIRSAEEEIQRRNKDLRLRNRCGAGVSAYELLTPSSGPGITCRGVPNSITI